MRFPADAPVTEPKKAALRERIERLGIELQEIDEQFVRSGGPGGQKVNKTSTAVVLRYPKLELVVKWSRERSQALNRFLALRELVDRVELQISPETSERLQDRSRIRRRKSDRARRQRGRSATS